MKLPERDYYKILGVKPISTITDIKAAYRELSKRYHPDIASDKEEAKRIMQLINEAFEYLSDPHNRKLYDNHPIFKFKPIPEKYKSVKVTTSRGKRRTTRAPSVFERVVNPLLQVFGVRKGEGVDLAKAKEHFELALMLISNDRVSEGLLRNALEEFLLALKYDPVCYETYYNIALIYYKLGEFDKALKYLQEAKKVKNTLEVNAFIKLLS